MQNFRLVSEFQTIQRRAFELADPTILVPTASNPLIDGEFLELNSSYKMARGTANPAGVPGFAYFAERGRYETQAIQKGPFLLMGQYEADTLVFDSTGITTVGQRLMVNDVTYGSLTRRGLKLAASGGWVVGYVTRLPASNGGYLRFIKTDSAVVL